MNGKRASGRVIGLDVGDRRIGVAVSDPLQVVARPLEIIDRCSADALSRVIALCREHSACAVVVGLPLHTNGLRGAQAEQAEAFADQLRAALHVPVVLRDERFTTQEARQILSEQRQRRRIMHDDALAAAIVLQRYLDARALAEEGIDSDHV